MASDLVLTTCCYLSTCTCTSRAFSICYISGIVYCAVGRGVATGVDIGIYTPPKSAKLNLWGKNDVRTAIQRFYPPPKTFIPPQNKFLATPLAVGRLIGRRNRPISALVHVD